MELKSYQKEVIADLARYLELVVELQSPAKAYQTLWNEKNVLVGFGLDQCSRDLIMRPYITLRDAGGATVTLYGGSVQRSIGYIATQNRTVFPAGTPAYEYVWNIIRAVYGDAYDSDYQG